MEYKLIRSARKTIAIQITPEAEVVVRAPKRCSKAAIDAFVREKEGWIQEHLRQTRARQEELKAQRESQPAWSEADYARARRLARTVFRQKATLYGDLMQVTFGGITVRDQKTRWGSCSGKGTLSFNWRLMLAPPAVLDYVVVHELCHLTHMDHSKAFWALVESVCPDYRVHRKWLKEHGQELIL